MDSIYTVNNFDSPLKQKMQTERLEDELRLDPLEDQKQEEGQQQEQSAEQGKYQFTEDMHLSGEDDSRDEGKLPQINLKRNGSVGEQFGISVQNYRENNKNFAASSFFKVGGATSNFARYKSVFAKVGEDKKSKDLHKQQRNTGHMTHDVQNNAVSGRMTQLHYSEMEHGEQKDDYRSQLNKHHSFDVFLPGTNSSNCKEPQRRRHRADKNVISENPKHVSPIK